MARVRVAKTARPHRFKVGDRVRFRFGGRSKLGVIVEDRGPIGVGGRTLYTVRARADRWNELVLELPADDLRAA